MECSVIGSNVCGSFCLLALGRESWLLCFVCSWCHVIVVWLFLVVPQVGLQFVIVVFSDHTH